MRFSLVALLALLTSGCAAHAHRPVSTVYVATPPPTTKVVYVAPSPTIRYHYVYTNSTWVRRTGAPPAGSRYHAHPRHSHSVIVHRSTSPRASHGHQPRAKSTTKVVRRSTR